MCWIGKKEGLTDDENDHPSRMMDGRMVWGEELREFYVRLWNSPASWKTYHPISFQLFCPSFKSISPSIHPCFPQSIHSPVNQSIYQSNPFNQSTHQSIHLSINQIIHSPVNQSIHSRVNQSIHSPVNQSIYPSINPFVHPFNQHVETYQLVN